jgi:polar amino acid transport system substrate-binding protein
MKPFFMLFLLILCTLFSCSEHSSKEFKVGVDPTWAPLQFSDRQDNITAFSTELLTEIGKIQKIPFVRVTKNWDDLLQGLKQQEYEAILSSMPPYLFNQKLFNFSEVYLALGPVLVVGIDSPIDSIDHLQGKEIAVISGSSTDLLLQKAPGVLIRYYPSDPLALNDIINGTIEGALIDILTATAYCSDLYQNELKIVTPPLTDEGLRLITLYGKAGNLVKKFNSGLDRLKKDGSYNKLLDKWGLYTQDKL